MVPEPNPPGKPSAAKTIGDHDIPLPAEYEEYADAYEWTLRLIDQGIISVVSDFNDVDNPGERVVIVEGNPPTIYVQETNKNAGTDLGFDSEDVHIEDITDNPSKTEINVENKSNNQITLKGGRVEPETLILPEL